MDNNNTVDPRLATQAGIIIHTIDRGYDGKPRKKARENRSTGMIAVTGKKAREPGRKRRKKEARPSLFAN